jgi:pyridine nucleotide-disulfide oxidoreductase family protein
MKRLLLVGGGHAHLAVLRHLALHRRGDLEVTLVTPVSRQLYSGMLPGWIAGHYRLEDCLIDLEPLAAAAGVRLILDRVVAVDAAARVLRPDGSGPLDYDLLSLDVGSETDTAGLEALGDRLLPLRPLEVFLARWPRLLAQARTQQAVSLVVVGGGAAGVEVALAARRALSGLTLPAQLHLIASEAGLLGGHAPGVRERARRCATRAGVIVHDQRGVGTEAGVQLSDGTLLRADAVIAATGARAPGWLAGSGLALDEAGYILVDAHHRSLSHDDVFAAGDVCSRPDTVLMRSGVHAVQAGPVLARNLLAALAGQPLEAYRPKARPLYLLACGERHAIASWGAWSAEGRWVWRWKDAIDRRFVARG